MKLMIASDLHGSAYWTKLLVERFREEAADRLMLLGDLLYHGPRNDLPREYDPKRVIDLLNPLAGELLCVRGNCDSEVDQMVLRFPILAEYAVISVGDRLLYAIHGHHPELASLLERSGSILVQGHTHVPMCEEKTGFLHLNPGSVSIPKDGSENGYMVLEDGVFTWKRVTDGTELRRYAL